MSQPTRVLLADDHTILRSGLKFLIENQPDLTVVGEAGDGNEAIQQARRLQPDVVLLDLNMPNMDGLSALPLVKEASPASRVLILTMHDDVNYLQRALKSGADGYVLKKAVDNELLMAVRAVMRGETYIHSAMTAKLLQNVMPEKNPAKTATDPWKNLSERELDVLRLVALGFTNGEVAEALFLSVKTVETYRARGMEKLNLQTRAQLVKSALEHGHMDEK